MAPCQSLVETFPQKTVNVSTGASRKICTPDGVVRLNRQDMADQQRPRLSRGELTPFSERGSAVLFENVSAVEVAVVVEMIMDRGVDGSKFLEGLYVPEPCHRLSLPNIRS